MTHGVTSVKLVHPALLDSFSPPLLCRVPRPCAWERTLTTAAKVQRFSPQDLMALRRAPTRPLGKMPILGADISVIVSEEPLEPVTATPADEEAISKVCIYIVYGLQLYSKQAVFFVFFVREWFDRRMYVCFFVCLFVC